MNTKLISKSALTALACGCALLTASISSAATIDYHVNVTTSPLVGNAAGPFSLDFQLNDGSGTGDGNNTATIVGFNFGGGSATGTPTLLGGASGNLSSAVTLKENTPFNEFYQTFTPGLNLTFDVLLTLNPSPSGTPDAFSFAILDNTLANITTTGIADSLFNVDISSSPVAQTGSSTGISGITASATVPDLPSRATIFVAALGLAGVGRCLQRKRLAV